jgi:hypothetical protein
MPHIPMVKDRLLNTLTVILIDRGLLKFRNQHPFRHFCDKHCVPISETGVKETIQWNKKSQKVEIFYLLTSFKKQELQETNT